MPYIKKEDRVAFAEENVGVLFPLANNAGELNYAITKVVLEYINDGVPINYQKFNDALGALEGAKLELYRRLIAPYEDKKIEENGDVFHTYEDA